MSSPWDVYDALIDDLPQDVTVVLSDRGTRWTRVVNSAGGIGSAWSMRGTSRPALSADVPDAGRPIRDVAALVRSWNLAEASVGLAAINSWYSRAEVAAQQAGGTGRGDSRGLPRRGVAGREPGPGALPARGTRLRRAPAGVPGCIRHGDAQCKVPLTR